MRKRCGVSTPLPPRSQAYFAQMQAGHNLLTSRHNLIETRIKPLARYEHKFWMTGRVMITRALMSSMRNVAGHGGNILEDYFAINEMEEVLGFRLTVVICMIAVVMLVILVSFLSVSRDQYMVSLPNQGKS